MRSRVATSSVASAVTVSWKTGACQASVSRRAIVWRVFVSSTTSNSGAAAGAPGATAGRASAFSTSSAIDAALGAGPGDRCEVDATFARNATGEWARLHMLSVRATCDRVRFHECRWRRFSW